MGNGRDLEALTAAVFRGSTGAEAVGGSVQVEENVMLDGADGPRQIDVLIRTKVGPIELTTIIECKDYSKKVNVMVVDALHSVMADVRASKAILVTRGGFSKTALQKARRLGIGMFRADQVANAADVAFEVPIHVREIRHTSLQVEGAVYLEGGTSINRRAILAINDADVPALLREDLLANPELVDLGSGRHEWTPTSISPPWFMRGVEGRRWEVDHLRVSYELAERHFFGYVKDLSAALFLKDEIGSETHVILKAEDFFLRYADDLQEFRSVDDLPARAVLTAEVAVVPNELDLADAIVNFNPIGRAPAHNGSLTDGTTPP